MKAWLHKVCRALALACVSACVAANVAHADSISVELPGDTHEAPTLQAALNEVRGSGKVVTVRLGAGTYTIDRMLKIYSNTKLVLEKGAVIRRADSAVDKPMLHDEPTQNVAHNDASMGGYKIAHDITIQGGTIDGGAIAKASKATDLVRIDHASNIKIQGVSFKNVCGYHMVEFAGVKNGSISNCSFTGYRALPGYEKSAYGGEAVQLDSTWRDDARNPKGAAWISGSVLDGTHDEDCSVTGCTFTNMPSAVGQHHSAPGTSYSNSRRITIANNTIRSTNALSRTKSAVTCIGLDQLTVRGNTISGPYAHAVVVRDARTVTLQGNVAAGSTASSICTVRGVGGLTVSSNRVGNSASNGIRIVSASGVTLVGNSISSPKADGLCIADSNNVTVRGNAVASPAARGLRISASKNVSASANSVSSAGKDGICATDSQRVTLVSNTVQRTGGDGIELDDCADATLRSNSASKPAGIGVRVGGKRLNVKSNSVSEGKSDGIRVQAASGVVLEGNRVRTCKGTGVHMKDIVGCRALGNKVSNAGKDGMRADEVSRISITGNKLEKSKRDGVRLSASVKAAKLDSNRVTRSGRSGVALAGGKKITIKRNRITRSGHNGLEVDGGTLRSVAGNTISSSADHGISVGAGSVGSAAGQGITSNTVTGAKNGSIVAVWGTAKVRCIRKNKLSATGKHGISVRDTARVKRISGNVIKWPDEFGLLVSSKKTKTLVKSNTFYLEAASKDDGLARDYDVATASKGTKVTHNAVKVKVVKKAAKAKKAKKASSAKKSRGGSRSRS